MRQLAAPLEADFCPEQFPVSPSPVTWKIVYEAAQVWRYPVSTKLNNSQNEGAESAAPVTLNTPI